MIKMAAFGVQGALAFWVFSFITFLLGFALASIVYNLRSRRRCLSCDALLSSEGKNDAR